MKKSSLCPDFIIVLILFDFITVFLNFNFVLKYYFNSPKVLNFDFIDVLSSFSDFFQFKIFSCLYFRFTIGNFQFDLQE